MCLIIVINIVDVTVNKNSNKKGALVIISLKKLFLRKKLLVHIDPRRYFFPVYTDLFSNSIPLLSTKVSYNTNK